MKRVFLAIIDPPWLFLILGWPVFVIMAMIYAWPSSMDEFVDTAPTPQRKLAILREIKGAELRVVLEFAGGVLKKLARVVPDEDERAELDRAQEKLRERIEKGVVPPSAVDKDDNDDKAAASGDKSGDKPGDKSGDRSADKSADPPKTDADAAAPSAKPSDSKAARKAEKLAEKRARDRERKRDLPGIGIEVNDKGDLHVDLGFVDHSLAAKLESTYGKGPLPVVEPEFKQRIYEGVQRRVHQFVFGVLTVVMLILSFPLFVASKIVMSIVRAFSNRAAQSEKVAQQNSLARQLTEARLAAMQAQIEPHFLFNTMASVQQLIETDPPAAAKMQADLIKYLRGAVPQMRESTSTLAREIELSTAYLDILKIRMEHRLTYSIDVPPELMGAGFPPMMLPTLVENAIKHGLEPLTSGGEIRIAAAAVNGKLRVSVADTGMGFAHQPGKGVGLSNVRERLAAMYGRNAQLIVEPNQPRGAKLTIEIPLPRSQTP
jgi:hypothetical protein